MKIKVMVKNCKLVDLNKLEHFQGKLKDLPESALEKLMASIKRNGFNAPVFVWAGHDYILDGHQRILAIKALIGYGHELEGNKVPVLEVEAKDEKQAAELVLTYNSQYGVINQTGLDEFMKRFDLNIDYMSEIVDFNVDNLKHIYLDKNIDNDEKEYDENINTEHICPKCGYKW